MSVFTEKDKVKKSTELSSLKLAEKDISGATQLFIYFKEFDKRANLPLPRAGRKFISEKAGDITFMVNDDADIMVVGADDFDETVHVSKKQYLMATGAKVYDAMQARGFADKKGVKNFNWLEKPKATDLPYILYGMVVRSFNRGEGKVEVALGGCPLKGDTLNAVQEGHATNFTRTLINMPYGIHVNNENKGLDVKRFAMLLKEKFNITACFETREELAKIGAGGILSVGRASAESPALLEATYCHKDCETDTPAVFIAKGMMYDSGGAAVKPPGSMKNMKYDMSAAAIAAGMLEKFQLTGAKCHVKVIFCLAENAVSDRMVYNGDHVQMLDGKMVHNTNTDAEGRMVLYDGLVYAQTKTAPHATCYLTMGTLTGTSKMVFGGRCGLFYAKGQQLGHSMNACNDGTGRVNDLFHIPDDPRTDNVVKSAEDGVDLVNSSSSIASGSEYCYKFIKQAVIKSNQNRYVHVDIGGGFVFDNKDITGEPLSYESGTGWGVTLMSEFFSRMG